MQGQPSGSADAVPIAVRHPGTGPTLGVRFDRGPLAWDAAVGADQGPMVQRQVQVAMTGRVFGTLCGAVGAAAAISYLAGAALLATNGPRVTFIVAGSIGLLCTITAAAVIRSHPPKPSMAAPHEAPRL